MKSLAFLVFLFLAVPGSGQLAWDGIPFSTRIEFATLVLFLLAIFNRTIRDWVRTHLARLTWRGAVKPALALLVLLKFLTFTWYPFSDGFDACYRSLYKPLTNANACEKSYEGPFLRRSDLGLANTSRTDRTIDFGVHAHDWSLPFMNEYPRLGALWLNRFPFSARYGARIENSTDSTKFVPILSIGKLEAWTEDHKLSLENYEFEQLSIFRLEPGSHEFNLAFEYTDDGKSETPEISPTPRGPYASLKVGTISTSEKIASYAGLRVRGWVFNTATSEVPEAILVRFPNSGFSKRFEMIDRPDVATHFDNVRLVKSGFDFILPLSEARLGQVELVADFGAIESRLGSIRFDIDNLSKAVESSLESSNQVLTQFSGSLVADRSDFESLKPSVRYTPGQPFGFFALLVDFVGLILFIGLLCGLFVVFRRTLFIASALGAFAFGAVSLSSALAPSIFGTKLFLPLLAMSILVLRAARQFDPVPPATFLPMSVVLAHHHMSAFLECCVSGAGVRWWGRLIFYWRDSDWFANQGFARQIFTDGSLLGGENVFWFQAGPRYLALFGRLLVGENDALVGLIVMSVGFFAVFVLSTSFMSIAKGPLALIVSSLLLLLGLMFLSDFVMIFFGFVVSSEYPTWAALLLVTGFVVTTHSESRPWLMVAMAIALGYSIQLRPNQIGGIVLLFIALLLLVDRRDAPQAIATVSKMTVAFAALVVFSLMHNLYYGESFVPFTGNAGINYQFSWLDVLGINNGDATWVSVWAQLRYMLYWNSVGNWSWALMFWGSQFLWLGVVAYRLRIGLAPRVRSLLLLIPFGYALPMLKYQMGSYYPRHLVVINLSFMCAALMAWPREDEMSDGETGSDTVGETTESSSASVAVNVVVS